MEIQALRAEVVRVGNRGSFRDIAKEKAADPAIRKAPVGCSSQHVAGLGDGECECPIKIGVHMRDRTFPDTGQDARLGIVHVAVATSPDEYNQKEDAKRP